MTESLQYELAKGSISAFFVRRMYAPRYLAGLHLLLTQCVEDAVEYIFSEIEKGSCNSLSLSLQGLQIILQEKGMSLTS